MEPLPHKVFVYGTLKRGQPNHYVFTDTEHGEARFVGKASTKEKYPLVIAGPFNIPFCLNKQGHGQHIKGELWEVDDKMLAFLDEIEQVPKFYQRVTREIFLDDNGEVEAQMYQLSGYKKYLLDLPYLQEYDSLGPHNLPFVPIYLWETYEGRSSFEVKDQPADSP